MRSNVVLKEASERLQKSQNFYIEAEKVKLEIREALLSPKGNGIDLPVDLRIRANEALQKLETAIILAANAQASIDRVISENLLSEEIPTLELQRLHATLILKKAVDLSDYISKNAPTNEPNEINSREQGLVFRNMLFEKEIANASQTDMSNVKAALKSRNEARSSEHNALEAFITIIEKLEENGKKLDNKNAKKLVSHRTPSTRPVRPSTESPSEAINSVLDGLAQSEPSLPLMGVKQQLIAQFRQLASEYRLLEIQDTSRLAGSGKMQQQLGEKLKKLNELNTIYFGLLNKKANLVASDVKKLKQLTRALNNLVKNQPKSQANDNQLSRKQRRKKKTPRSEIPKAQSSNLQTPHPQKKVSFAPTQNRSIEAASDLILPSGKELNKEITNVIKHTINTLLQKLAEIKKQHPILESTTENDVLHSNYNIIRNCIDQLNNLIADVSKGLYDQKTSELYNQYNRIQKQYRNAASKINEYLMQPQAPAFTQPVLPLQRPTELIHNSGKLNRDEALGAGDESPKPTSHDDIIQKKDQESILLEIDNAIRYVKELQTHTRKEEQADEKAENEEISAQDLSNCLEELNALKHQISEGLPTQKSVVNQTYRDIVEKYQLPNDPIHPENIGEDEAPSLEDLPSLEDFERQTENLAITKSEFIKKVGQTLSQVDELRGISDDKEKAKEPAKGSSNYILAEASEQLTTLLKRTTTSESDSLTENDEKEYESIMGKLRTAIPNFADTDSEREREYSPSNNLLENLNGIEAALNHLPIIREHQDQLDELKKEIARIRTKTTQENPDINLSREMLHLKSLHKQYAYTVCTSSNEQIPSFLREHAIKLKKHADNDIEKYNKLNERTQTTTRDKAMEAISAHGTACERLLTDITTNSLFLKNAFSETEEEAKGAEKYISNQMNLINDLHKESNIHINRNTYDDNNRIIKQTEGFIERLQKKPPSEERDDLISFNNEIIKECRQQNTLINQNAAEETIQRQEQIIGTLLNSSRRYQTDAYLGKTEDSPEHALIAQIRNQIEEIKETRETIQSSITDPELRDDLLKSSNTLIRDCETLIDDLQNPAFLSNAERANQNANERFDELKRSAASLADTVRHSIPIPVTPTQALLSRWEKDIDVSIEELLNLKKAFLSIKDERGWKSLESRISDSENDDFNNQVDILIEEYKSLKHTLTDPQYIEQEQKAMKAYFEPSIADLNDRKEILQKKVRAADEKLQNDLRLKQSGSAERATFKADLEKTKTFKRTPLDIDIIHKMFNEYHQQLLPNLLQQGAEALYSRAVDQDKIDELRMALAKLSGDLTAYLEVLKVEKEDAENKRGKDYHPLIIDLGKNGVGDSHKREKGIAEAKDRIAKIKVAIHQLDDTLEKLKAESKAETTVLHYGEYSARIEVDDPENEESVQEAIRSQFDKFTGHPFDDGTGEPLVKGPSLETAHSKGVPIKTTEAITDSKQLSVRFKQYGNVDKPTTMCTIHREKQGHFVAESYRRGPSLNKSFISKLFGGQNSDLAIWADEFVKEFIAARPAHEKGSRVVIPNEGRYTRDEVKALMTACVANDVEPLNKSRYDDIPMPTKAQAKQFEALKIAKVDPKNHQRQAELAGKRYLVSDRERIKKVEQGVREKVKKQTPEPEDNGTHSRSPGRRGSSTD